MHRGKMTREIEGDGADTMAGGDHETKKKPSKRTKTGIPSSSSSEVSNFSLNDVQIILIEELLLRLPTKFVFQCKCVCKNWYFLISSPYFVRRYITHHFNHHYNQNPSALLIGYLCKPHGYRLFAVSDEPILKSRGFELNYLFHDHEKSGPVKVLAIHKDLMLCSTDKVDKSGVVGYYICNPFTMQCFAVPLLRYEDELRSSFRVGFVCEPYYFEDSQGECTLSCNYRFRIVHIIVEVTNITESMRLIMWMYCSETRKWYRSVLVGQEYVFRCTDVVAYDGKLLWYNGRNIFAYDPFDPELSTFIDCSYIRSTRFLDSDIFYSDSYCIGVCKGSLRVMQLVGGSNRKSLAIWELKDYATTEWSLEFKDFLDTMIPESSEVQDIVDRSKYILRLLGFHPSDGDIVYFRFQNFIITCNTGTRELKMVGEGLAGGVNHSQRDVFHIELPLWPTPISKPIEIIPCS